MAGSSPAMTNESAPVGSHEALWRFYWLGKAIALLLSATKFGLKLLPPNAGPLVGRPFVGEVVPVFDVDVSVVPVLELDGLEEESDVPVVDRDEFVIERAGAVFVEVDVTKYGDDGKMLLGEKIWLTLLTKIAPLFVGVLVVGAEICKVPTVSPVEAKL